MKKESFLIGYFIIPVEKLLLEDNKRQKKEKKNQRDRGSASNR